METQKPDTEPKRETTETEEQGGESQPQEATPLPVAEPAHSEAKERDAEEAKDITDREQDEAIDELAVNTKLIAQQTKWEKMQGQWVRNQFWASATLGVLTLLVLAYQSVMISGQLESMQSSSNQTQEMIRAMQKQANASQDTAAATKSVAEQQSGLAKSAEMQANASQTQANASKDIVGQNGRLIRTAEVQAGVLSEQASTARKQFELTDRPWLYVVVEPDGDLTFSDDRVHLPVRYEIQNVGRSTAVQVTTNATVVMLGGEGREVGEGFREIITPLEEPPWKQQREQCEQITRWKINPLAITIFPNETKSLRVIYSIQKRAMEAHSIGDEKSVAIALAGCVDYLFGDQSSQHQTGFIYEFMVDDPMSPDSPRHIRIGQDVPIGKLFLFKYRGGDYAN
jgi:hypothetical protein